MKEINWKEESSLRLSLFSETFVFLLILTVFLFFQQIDEDPSLVPEAIQGGTYGFNSSANVPAEGFQF